MNKVIEIYWYTPIIRKLIVIEKTLIHQEKKIQKKKNEKLMKLKPIKLETISNKYTPEIEKLLKKLKINP